MRRLLIALAFVLAACSTAGDAGDTTTTTDTPTTTAGATTTTTTEPPGFTVTSDDGMVTVEVPSTSMAEDPGITIERMAPEDYPEDLAGLADTPGSAVYELGPDGPSFDGPVTVTRRIPADEFADLADFTVPLVTLITTTPDHEGWEYLGDLSVTRDGDEIVVSGTTTHFSMLASAGEQVSLEVRFLQVSDDFATEVGVDFDFDTTFLTDDGEAVDPPPSTAVVPSGDEAVTVSGGAMATLACSTIGDRSTRIAWNTSVRRSGDANELQLLITPHIVPGDDPTDLDVGFRTDVRCLDPELAITGRNAEVTVQADHPGGKEIVPGGDFRGGNSAVVATVSGLGDAPFGDSILIGLIEDCDFDGVISDGDFIYPPVLAGSSGSAVIPIFEFGDYFVYTIDGSAFGDLSSVTEQTTSIPILSALPVLNGLFTGSGRFASSIGVAGGSDGPIPFTVGSSEDPTTRDAELIIFVTATLVESAE